MEDEQNYKGHLIKLLARKMDDDKWSCNCAVTKSGKTATAHGFSVDGDGNTEEESKQQALEKAHDQIDSILN